MISRRIQANRRVASVIGASVLAFATACGSPSDHFRDMAAKGMPVPAKYKLIAVGDQAPLYEMPTLAGDSVHVGKTNQPVTVMNVWATWCVSCREEMHDLQALHDEYQARGVRVLGVSVDESDVARVRKFVEKEKLTFSMVHDRDGRVQQLYQVSGIPNTFIIDKDGHILWKSIGNLHGVVDSLRRVLNTTGH